MNEVRHIKEKIENLKFCLSMFGILEIHLSPNIKMSRENFANDLKSCQMI